MMGPRNLAQSSEYVYDYGQCLIKVDVVRGLGYTITSHFGFSKHCRMLVRRACYRLCNIFRTLKSTIPEAYIATFKTSVRPIVEAGATVFKPTKKKYERDMKEKKEKGM